MVALPMPERRRRAHVQRPFERRTAGGMDLRVVAHLEELGIKKVESELVRGGFNGRSAMVNNWLKSKKNNGGFFARLGQPGMMAVIGAVALAVGGVAAVSMI